MDTQLIDRIYECSFVPELWRGVLAELAKVASARTGFLFVSNAEIHRWTSSTTIGIEALQPLVESGWIARSERFRRLRAAPRLGFMTEQDIYTAEELKTDPFYRDILYPRGLGWAAGTAISMPTGDIFSLNLERDYDRGPVETSVIENLDALRPHIARSAFIAARLQLESARAAGDTLAAIGLAALVLDEQGKVLAANALIEAVAEFIQWRARDRIALNDKTADRLLRDALSTPELERAGCVRSFPLRDASAQTMLVAHVIPLRRSARDLFARSASALVLTPVKLPQTPPVELVQSLFDLTPSEARVARSLASGKSVDDIAADTDVSTNTIRTHVRGVLEKTGCNRQAEIVALLSGIRVLGPD